MKKAFISYQHEDAEQVFKMVKIMENDIGLDVWIDKKRIFIGQKFATLIDKAIEEADFFVMMVSHRWYASDYCKKEFDAATALKKKIFPIYLETCEIPKGRRYKALSDLHHINAYELSDDELTWSLRKSDLVDRYQRGTELYMDGKFEEAVKFFTLAATDDNSKEAQMDLGMCCMYGYGIEENQEKGAAWMQKAAKSDAHGKGLPQAQRELGKCYEIGEGVFPDETKAAKWYLKAAREGQDMHAMYLAAKCYDEGIGVKADKKKAFEWYVNAAKKGHPMSMYIVGRFYDKGNVVPKDNKLAAEWYHRAADENCPDGINAYGVMLYFGTGVEKNPEEAVKYYLRAAEMGSREAQYNLATRYAHGNGVEADPVQAFVWYDKAAKGGDQDAQFCIGIRLYYGIGVTKNQALGMEWLIKAEENGNAQAERFLKLLRNKSV